MTEQEVRCDVSHTLLVIVYQSLARRRGTLKRDLIQRRALTVSHAPSATQTAKVSANTAMSELHRISPQLLDQSSRTISSRKLNATETTSPAATNPGSPVQWGDIGGRR